MIPSVPSGISLLDDAILADPYHYYARLRSEDPVHWSDRHNAWLLTRYEDVRNAFSDERLTSEKIQRIYAHSVPVDEQPSVKNSFEHLAKNWFGFTEPPDHTRLRGLVRKAFTPTVVRGLEHWIRPLADDLAEDVARRLRRGDDVEFMSEFARVLPGKVIVELLGIPQTDTERLRAWMHELVLLIFGAPHVPDRTMRAHRGLEQLEGYMHDRLDRASARTGDDLLSHLLRAEEAGRALDRDEVVGAALSILLAGDHTTGSLIGNALWALLRSPDQRDLLTQDPPMIPTAIDELIRFEGPVRLTVRLARTDHELHGRRIRAGDRLFLMLAAANRDPQVFHDPERLDVTRTSSARHLDFGHGIHYCVGAALARTTAAAALNSILATFPDVRIASRPVWEGYLVPRSMTSLVLREARHGSADLGAPPREPVVDRHLCVGSGTCVSVAPGAFALHDGAARVVPGDEVSESVYREAAEMCPVGAISIRVPGKPDAIVIGEGSEPTDQSSGG